MIHQYGLPAVTDQDEAGEKIDNCCLTFHRLEGEQFKCTQSISRSLPCLKIVARRLTAIKE